MSSIKTRAAGQEHADGQLIGTTGEKLAFLGAVPVVRRVGAAQTALTDNTTGVANAVLAAVTNPDLSAWNAGTDPTAAQAVAINAAITSLKNAVASQAVLINELRATLVALGLAKGAA